MVTLVTVEDALVCKVLCTIPRDRVRPIGGGGGLLPTVLISYCTGERLLMCNNAAQEVRPPAKNARPPAKNARQGFCLRFLNKTKKVHFQKQFFTIKKSSVK